MGRDGARPAVGKLSCPVRVPAVCCAPKQLERAAAHNAGPTNTEGWTHNSRRHLIRIVPPIPGLWLCYTHANCVCNQRVSAANRVLGEVPLPSQEGVRELQLAARRLFARLDNIEPWSLERVANSFTGPRKQRYLDALASLETDPLTKRDALVRGFVKSEKFNPVDKVNPDPRMIQYRGHRYNIHLASYLRPIEHQMWRMKEHNGFRLFAKGLDAERRAMEVRRRFDRFPGCVCYSLDGSRWDKHVAREVLEVEHAVYKRLAPDPELYQLLDWQLTNKCQTMEGTKWRVRGARMSGDMNTALGNCVLMATMVHAFAKKIGLKRWSLLDDGDDCLLFFTVEEEGKVRGALSREFLSYGQEVKLENRATTPEQVVFCQSRPLWDGERWRLVRPWRKVLAQGTSGVKHWNNPNSVRPMFTTLGWCELALSAGVPILQEYALALIRMGRGEQLKTLDVESGLAERVRAEVGSLEKAFLSKARPITIEARLSFDDAWGVDMWTQLEWERRLREWELDSTIAMTVEDEWDYRWVDMTRPDVQCSEV